MSASSPSKILCPSSVCLCPPSLGTPETRTAPQGQRQKQQTKTHTSRAQTYDLEVLVEVRALQQERHLGPEVEVIRREDADEVRRSEDDLFREVVDSHGQQNRKNGPTDGHVGEHDLEDHQAFVDSVRHVTNVVAQLSRNRGKGREEMND